MNKSFVLSITALGLAVTIANIIPMGTAYAQGGQIYGSQLMTEQERTQFRLRMQADDPLKEKASSFSRSSRLLQG